VLGCEEIGAPSRDSVLFDFLVAGWFSVSLEEGKARERFVKSEVSLKDENLVLNFLWGREAARVRW